MAETTNGPDYLVLRYLRSIHTRVERVERNQLEHDHDFAALRASFASLRADIARLGRRVSAGGPWQ